MISNNVSLRDFNTPLMVCQWFPDNELNWSVASHMIKFRLRNMLNTFLIPVGIQSCIHFINFFPVKVKHETMYIIVIDLYRHFRDDPFCLLPLLIYKAIHNNYYYSDI